MAEIFFAIRRGSFGPVRELTAATRRFTDGWDDRCLPFTRTRPADGILTHAMSKENLMCAARPGCAALTGA